MQKVTRNLWNIQLLVTRTINTARKDNDLPFVTCNSLISMSF